MKRKLVSLLAFILATTCAFGLTACDTLSELFGNNEKNSFSEGSLLAAVESVTDTMVAIKVEKAEEKTTLMDVMAYLQEEKEFSFKVVDGMVTEINGTANAADWSACWMLYTSDTEMSNTAWGTCEYEGQNFGSAILGAEILPVIDGGVYIWVYQEL